MAKQSTSNKAESIIKPNERTTVYATAGARYHTKGSPMTVGTKMAEKLLEQGKAAKTQEEALASDNTKSDVTTGNAGNQLPPLP